MALQFAMLESENTPLPKNPPVGGKLVDHQMTIKKWGET